ncbi:MAG: DUF63 family protein [Methanobacteriota archaeon]
MATLGERWDAFYESRKVVVWAVALGLPLLVLVAGLVLEPDLFYDRFLWRHFWGPTVADASQRGVATHDGITADEGYTLVAEAGYGILLALFLYAVYTQILQRFDVDTGPGFVLALVPISLLGPLARALEDTSIFCLDDGRFPCDPATPWVYLFISPFIYFTMAAFALLFVLLGVWFASLRGRVARSRTTLVFALLLAFLASCYSLIYALQFDRFATMASPVVVFAGAGVAIAAFAALSRRYQWPGVNVTTFAGGLFVLLPAVVLITAWVAGRTWDPVGTWDGVLHPEVLAPIFGMTILAVGGVYALGRLTRNEAPVMSIYTDPLNLSILFGHALDGFASFVAIKDPFDFGLGGYSEKHPVSDYFLQLGGGWGFPILKVLLIAGIVYLMDHVFRKDLEEDRRLVGLVKLAILVLGLGPGVRDVARVAMGI